jgi:dipeptidase E
VLSREDQRKRVLLLSNSIQHGHGYLDHAESEIQGFLGNIKRVLFIPYAMFNHKEYASKNRARFAAMGYEVASIHTSSDPCAEVENADAVFIGGGNTFLLLNTIYEKGLLDVLRSRVFSGMPYLGSSAGSVVAGPTLKTTNDMPIVQPSSFASLGIVNFQINAHYLDPDPGSTHMGETREERLLQYLEENEIPVLALREGAMVRVERGSVQLKGESGARLFRQGSLPEEIAAGTKLSR